MKTLLTIIIVLVVLGTGYYFFAMNPAPQQQPQEEAMEEMNNEEDTSMMETGEVKEFVVEGGMFYFSPESIEVNEGDTVRIVFKNVEGLHDWVIDEFNARTAVIQAGQEETIEFVANQKGEFEYYCSVGNHRAQGMVGTLIVR